MRCLILLLGPIALPAAAVDLNRLHSALSRILKFLAIEDDLDDPPTPVVVTDRLPARLHHGGRYLAFGRDGKLHVPIGAALVSDDQAGAIYRITCTAASAKEP